MNLFDEFLNEEVKHVSNDVIHYTTELVKLIQSYDLSKNNLKIKTDLLTRDNLKLSNLEIIIDINPIKFNNYGYFKLNNYKYKVIDDKLVDCIMYLELSLTESEIKNNIISPLNDIYFLINHELNHALEHYQYEIDKKTHRMSWEISKKYYKHRNFANQYKYWEDFIHLIYLGLEHEMNSRVSSVYQNIKNYKNPKEDIKNNNIYQDATLMSIFNFDSFYNNFIKKYDEKTFLFLCEQFCKDFDYNYINDIEYCKKLVNKIIMSFNKKGKKLLRKINNVIKRVEMENIGHIFIDMPIEKKNINHKNYIKN